ncbi:MAG: LptE family protein [Flavobacteriales bacterium]|nr:LptE family protein [Flavobacteriales bacterium]
MHIIKILIASAALVCSCGVYTFTGADIHPDAKTISVAYFQNQATLVQPTLSQQFTNDLQEYVIQQTNLNLIRSNGDLQFEGYISDYQIRPISISSSDQANQNRLSVKVFIRFTNQIEPEKSYEQTFTRYADFDSNLNLSQIEESLLEEIISELIEDLFNKAVVNW